MISRGADRRQFVRRKIQCEAALLYRGRYFYVNAVELGQGGMLIGTNSALVKGQKIELSFVIEDSSLFSVKAEICYSMVVEGKNYSGVRFIDLDQPHQRIIEDYVNR